MQGRVITISRQCGSGGHSIGNELAKRLNVPFYDKEIIEMTAKESGFHPQFVEEKGEHMESSMLSNLARHLSCAGRGNYEDYQPLQDQLYFTQVKVIKELVEKGPSVIVGRCARTLQRTDYCFQRPDGPFLPEMEAGPSYIRRQQGISSVSDSKDIYSGKYQLVF